MSEEERRTPNIPSNSVDNKPNAEKGANNLPTFRNPPPPPPKKK